MITGRPRLPVNSGHDITDFLLRVFDAEGTKVVDLADRISVSDNLISMIRRGHHKRLVNTTIARLAKHYGYRFALAPDDHPEIIRRPEHESIE